MRLVWRDCCSFNSIELSSIVPIALRTPSHDLSFFVMSHAVVDPHNVVSVKKSAFVCLPVSQRHVLAWQRTSWCDTRRRKAQQRWQTARYATLCCPTDSRPHQQRSVVQMDMPRQHHLVLQSESSLCGSRTSTWTRCHRNRADNQCMSAGLGSDIDLAGILAQRMCDHRWRRSRPHRACRTVKSWSRNTRSRHRNRLKPGTDTVHIQTPD